MDAADRAQMELEIQEKTLMSKRLEPETKPTGFCLYCKRKIDTGKFCDIDCSEDFEWEQNALKRKRG